MALDIKSWLETAGEPVEEVAFIPDEAPRMPYIVYLDTLQRDGGDVHNMSCMHAVTVERYSDIPEDNPALEVLFDDKALKYSREKMWLPDEECFMTIYEFEIYESEVL